MSSYAEGPRAAIDAFHVEAASGNPAFERAAKTLRDHFMGIDQEGPLQALQFRYGSNDAGEDGVRLKEDLVTIGRALVDFE